MEIYGYTLSQDLQYVYVCTSTDKQKFVKENRL
jgi:hypothetical protein